MREAGTGRSPLARRLQGCGVGLACHNSPAPVRTGYGEALRTFAVAARHREAAAQPSSAARGDCIRPPKGWKAIAPGCIRPESVPAPIPAATRGNCEVPVAVLGARRTRRRRRIRSAAVPRRAT